MSISTEAPPPIHLGPTWEKDAFGNWVLPKWTLGWQALAWIEKNLLAEESTPQHPIPFAPTGEQTRFILWWYAIDERGRFVYRDGILQRLKGWGKDPLLAVLAAVEFLGPCRFAGWLTVDRPDLDLVAGEPLAAEHPRAWVQIAAVSLVQTQNTMRIFPGLFSEACKKAHGMDKHSIGKTVIYAHGGTRQIEAVTSSPRSLEGGRPTFVVRNETHHWLANNEGHAMAAVIERNATKAKGGAARSLSITNAYEPSEDSFAQQQREAWEAEDEGRAVKTNILYDSLEAHPESKIAPSWPEGDLKDDLLEQGIEPTDAAVLDYSEHLTKEYLANIIRGVRGDSWWLDIEGLVNSVLDRKNPPSRSRRFWFNQVVTAEDAWAAPAAIRAAIDPLARLARERRETDALRAGWLVLPDDPIVVFFDGGKSDDATGLVGCRLSDGYVFTLGVWAKPPVDSRGGERWVVDRDAVDARVQEVRGRFKVVGFLADPSHALDDSSEVGRFWDSYIDKWHREMKDDLQYWSIRTGDNQHSIMWDMTSPTRQAQFVAAAETFISELEQLNDVEEYDPAFRIDGHPTLVEHMRNAIKAPGRYGVSLMKVNRESKRKIDLAVCAVGARMLRRFVLNRGLEEVKETAGSAWGAWGSY